MRKTLTRVCAYWALAGGLIILLITLVTTVNVTAFGLDRITRLFGHTVSGLPGYEDFVRLAVSCAALMFFPWCQVEKGHVAVDFFSQFLPGRLTGMLTRIWNVGLFCLGIFLAWWMTIGMLETRDDNALSRVLGWPEWPFYLPGVLSLALWAVVALTQAFGEQDNG